MPSRSKADVVRTCFAAYRDKDRGLIEPLLAADFTFTSPYDDTIDRATYFIRCWPNADRFRDIVVERVFVEGDEAFVTYRAFTTEGKEFRNTEFFTFSGDQVKSVNVYFGPTYADGVFVKGD